MLALYTKSLRCAPDVCIESLASVMSTQSIQVTGAHVESLCRRAVVMRIREEAAATTSEREALPSISMKNFVDALHEMCPPTVAARPTSSIPLPTFEWNGTGFVEGINPHPR